MEFEVLHTNNYFSRDTVSKLKVMEKMAHSFIETGQIATEIWNSQELKQLKFSNLPLLYYKNKQ